MMMDRQKELLRILLRDREEALHIQDLAEQLGCSEKTVRNDLKKIEGFLPEVSNGKLIRKPGIGIKLEMEEAERKELFPLLLSNHNVQSKEDRVIEIAYQLLTNEDPVTIQAMAKRHYVAKTVIKKDLEMIEKWLGDFDLALITKPRLGTIIQGTELRKRSALAHLPQLLATEDRNYVLDLFMPHEITTVRKALKDMQEHYHLSFTDGAIESLLVHALIMLKRTRQKSPVFVPEEEKSQVTKQKEYRYATYFFGKLEAVLRMSFPEHERIYFTWHLISSKMREESGNDELIADQFLQEVDAGLITKVSKLTLFPFEKDNILETGLAVHMHSVINRLKYGFPIVNPLLADIKKMYPYMFNMVMLALQEVKQTFDLEIPEDEAAYLVLHFQASLERMEGKREEQKKALIVCHMGVGMSHLLEAKIAQYDKDIHISACIGKADVRDFLRTNDVDFVISTVLLDKIEVPSVVISPLLEAKDKKKLSQFMETLDEKKDGIGGTSALAAFIRKELVHLEVGLEHRFEVVELLGDSLVEQGYVEKEFPHQALLRERKSATSVGGGIAIPHADPSLVKKSAIAVGVLKKPIEWGSELVSIVFMLAISNQEARSGVAEIAGLSENPELIQRLVEVQDQEEFFQILGK